jgi:hypothetical protein
MSEVENYISALLFETGVYFAEDGLRARAAHEMSAQVKATAASSPTLTRLGLGPKLGSVISAFTEQPVRTKQPALRATRSAGRRTTGPQTVLRL